MKTDKTIVNPEVKYFIISFKHTSKKDKYLTLWRPKNAGYCWPIELAGTYEGYEEGYHNTTDENIPVPTSAIPTKYLVMDDQGRLCIRNSKAVQNFIRTFIKI